MEKSEKQPHSRTMMAPWALSWRCYVIGILSYVLQLTSLLLSELGIISEQYFSSIYSAIIIQLSLLLFIKISVRPSQFDVAWRALLLGTVLNVGLILSTFTLKYQTLGIYLIFLSFFHWSEFMMQSIFNPDTTDVSSYMLYHSDAYVVAFIASLVEYSLELYLLPSMKQPTFLTNIGLTLLILGEGLRKVSMYTAKSNFNHYVQLNKNEGHELVTHGVYRLFRHPSYVGWFWWSVGTQVVLLNPVCVVLYAIASWKFFSERIYTEEMTLIQFFGEKYVEYQQKVGTGIPFIEGFHVPVINSPEHPTHHDKQD